MSPVIFISYSAKDEVLASAIHAFLNRSGIKAIKAPDDIAPGTNWAAAITDMIERCTHMVLVWTANSMASKEVSKELTLAMQCGAVIIPFRSENLAPEGAWRYHLSQVQWLEAHGMPEGQAMEALLLQVGGCADPDAPAVQQPERTVPPQPVKPPGNQAVEASSNSRQESRGTDWDSIRQKKRTAGLLALFLGGFGAHKFYLGRTLPGCTYLAFTTLMVVTGAFMSEGENIENAADVIGILLLFLISLTALVESITYFTRSVEDFERINIKGKRPWF